MSSFLDSFRKLKQAMLIAAISLSVMFCGGGGGVTSIITTGISGTGIVFGAITGFGSIFVNGVRYEIDNASLNIDGNMAALQSDLELGMVVKLTTTNYDDGSIEVNSVSYEDIVEGPISGVIDDFNGDANLKQITVLGLDIIVSDSGTSLEGVSFADLGINDIVEVSGFIDSSNKVVATRIEWDGVLGVENIEVEIHGQVKNLLKDIDENPVSFTINDVLIDLSQMAAGDFEDLEGGLFNDLYVEVEGLYLVAATIPTIRASEVEGEDDDLDEILSSDSDISLQGIITDYIDDSNFKVSGIPVDASAVSGFTLMDGMEIEVEGQLQNGILLADEIELRAGELKYQAVIKSVGADSIGVGLLGNNLEEISLLVDSSSQLEDEVNSNAITLQDLEENQVVKVKVLLDENNDKKVDSLKRLDPVPEKYEFSGTVTDIDNSDPLMPSVTLDNELTLQLEEPAISTEFASLVIGDTVELVDEGPNELFEKLEIK